MQKYYNIEWPESQEWMDDDNVILGDNMSAFVPCELYDKKS